MADPKLKSEAIVSCFQMPAGVLGGPEPYLFNAFGPLGTIQGQLEWQLFDFCRFHQVMYTDLKRQAGELDQRFAAFKQRLDATKPNDDDDVFEAFQVAQSRIYDAVIDKDNELSRLQHLADEYTVIGLWATAEQYLGRVYLEMETIHTGKTHAEIKVPYKWNDFVDAFAGRGIDLKALHDFQDADECRVVNNTIKHAGYVNARLGAYPYFAPHVGSQLCQIDLQMQRYLNGVSNLLGSLITAVSRLLDPSFRF